MEAKIRVCENCGRYGLGNNCKECGEKLINPEPPKFSLEDRYGKYRREEKLKSR